MSDATVVKPATPAGEAIVPGNGQTPKSPTLKLIYNRTHIGPTTGIKVAKTELSKATGKVMFNNQLKVKAVKEQGDKEAPAGHDKIDIPLGIDQAIKATKYFLAWDKKYKGEIGTPSYKASYKTFLAKQKEVYDSLGVSLSTDSKGRTIKPELTEQQRALYNEEMRACAFSYYEIRLSYKTPGVKAVRTLTYRTIKQPDLSKLNSELKALIADLETKVLIVPKQNN